MPLTRTDSRLVYVILSKYLFRYEITVGDLNHDRNPAAEVQLVSARFQHRTEC
jgi:hypothetical protein